MIEVQHLTKRYGSFTAVRDVSFTLEEGKIYGFLGPNGAGKSTTMNILTGCLAADEGSVAINGFDIYKDPAEAKASIGYLPELPPLYTDMTPEEYLSFVGEAKGLRGKKLDDDVERVIALTGLEPMRSRLMRNLSKGYRQRVGIAQALLADPPIIILDEPTVGLDPLQIIEIRSLIRSLGETHTVILSSHILTEISEVCDTVIILSGGRIVASDTIENLTKMHEGKSYVDLDVRCTPETARDAVSGIAAIRNLEVTEKEAGISHLRLETAAGDDIRDAVFFCFADRRLPILSMQYEEVTLENVFLSLTGEAPAAEGNRPDGAQENPSAGEAAEAEVPLETAEIASAPAKENSAAPASGAAKQDEPAASPAETGYTSLFDTAPRGRDGK